MRWYLSYPLSARQVAELLAERGIDVPARRVVKGWVLEPDQVVSDHHQHYVKAVKGALPGATHIRTGLHRRRGETTKSIERSPAAIRDWLRCWMPAADQGARAHSRSKLDPRDCRGPRFAGRGD